MSSSSAMAASGRKICFNVQCKKVLTEQTRRKGWRLRSGELSELCDRCYSIFDNGNFCETFHSDAAGWRKCESCGKRIHCGCIVSIPVYMLLDVGGVECMACVRNPYSSVPNQIRSPPMALSSQLPERSKEISVKSWNQVAGSFPGQWRHPANIWNSSSIQSDLHQRLSYEFDRPNTERLMAGVRSSFSPQEKKAEDIPERIASSGVNHVVRDMNGVKFETHRISPGNSSTIPKGDSTSLLMGLSVPFSSINGTSDPVQVSTIQPQRHAASSTLSKQCYSNSLNSVDSTGESPANMRNGRGQLDPKARSQLLPRYWPRITDQELQQISGDSNSVITPLFEKMLSASDAGRIGRLVLPKKCAEAYFPPISQPEGLPLKMQDASRKEWVFQFRFWPNNNSRMYVLEGVTPCIQSMQLQAGDTVTFSRIDPEGKLVMGFRKAANVSNNEQDIQAARDENDGSTPSDVKPNPVDYVATPPLRPHKGTTESKNQTNVTDKASLSKNDKTGFIQKDHGTLCRRKGSFFSSKSKRLRIESEESIELKLTWEEAQVLLRPAPNDAASVVSVEGHDIEEYEDAPVLGFPTYFAKNHEGSINNRWAQCQDCLKWRRLPLDSLLNHGWTCSDNKWDPVRSSCSAAQEISAEIKHLLPTRTGSCKRSKVKCENENENENENLEVIDGLDTLANLAILGEGDSLPSSSQPTTKHPRHRPGCSCIVCIQPPSGKGPKHKQTCTCNVCLTVKRRFRTLMLRREKRQSEKEADMSRLLPPYPLRQNAAVSSSPQMPVENSAVVDAESDRKQTATPSPIKTQIDLNIQPEREEEPSPVANSVNPINIFQDSVELNPAC